MTTDPTTLPAWRPYGAHADEFTHDLYVQWETATARLQRSPRCEAQP